MTRSNSSGGGTRYGVGVATGLMVIGAVARLIPHPANFTPVGSTSLFAGARIRGWHAYLLPLVLMAVTDPLLTLIYGYEMFNRVTPVIYGAFLVHVWIGRTLLAKVNPARVAATCALCSVQFFFLTNLGVWGLGNWYPHTFAGLVACFAAALPFLGLTMAGDLAYAGFLFGLDALAGRLRGKPRQEATAPVQRATV